MMRILVWHLLLFPKILDFTVDDGATKGQIKSAFVKSFKSKKLNKKVLGEFISLIS